MPYYRRRYRRRYGRALSARNVWGRTGAKSQAKQIWTLKKKLNALARKDRPETKLSFIAPGNQVFTNESLSTVYKWIPFSAIDKGTGDDQRVGNFVKSRGATYYLNFEYFDNLSTLEARGCQVRIIGLQWKENKGQSSAPSMAGVIQDFASTGDAYDLIAINPLAANITEYLHVLKDIRFRMDEFHPVKQMRIKLSPKDLRWDTANNVNNFGIVVVVTGLHWISSSDMEGVEMAYSGKFAFTDA